MDSPLRGTGLELRVMAVTSETPTKHPTSRGVIESHG